MANAKLIDDERGTYNHWTGKVYPAIGPDGQLLVRFADTELEGWHDAKAGQNPVMLSAGKAVIHPEFEKRGFVLYQDLCLGKVLGIEASPKHWERWLQYVKLMASGRIPEPGAIRDEDFYHPEVLRRRSRASAGGLAVMSADELVKFLGFDPEDKDAKPEDGKDVKPAKGGSKG